LTQATRNGFRKEQLYETASYQAKDLRGVNFQGSDLAGWDLSGQDLTGAQFNATDLTEANLRGATLINANFGDSIYIEFAFANLTGADMRGAYADLSEAVTRNTILSDGLVEGLELLPTERLRVHDDDDAPPDRDPRAPIPVTVHERMTMADESTLQLVFDSDNWDSLISFEPEIPVQLGGSLKLTFSDDIDLGTQVGRTLHIFDWTGVAPTGQFEIRSPYVWDTTKLYATGEVTLLAIPEPPALAMTSVIILAIQIRRSALRSSRPK
jgi:hypothetical protein